MRDSHAKGGLGLRTVIFRVLIPAMALLVCMVISPIYTFGTLGTLDFSGAVEFGLRLIIVLYLSGLSWSAGDLLSGIWNKDRLPRYARVIPRSLYSGMGVVFGIPWFVGMVLGLAVINTVVAFILFPRLDSWVWLLSGIGSTVAYMLVLGIALARLLYSIHTDDDWGLE